MANWFSIRQGQRTLIFDSDLEEENNDIAIVRHEYVATFSLAGKMEELLRGTIKKEKTKKNRYLVFGEFINKAMELISELDELKVKLDKGELKT